MLCCNCAPSVNHTYVKIIQWRLTSDIFSMSTSFWSDICKTLNIVRHDSQSWNGKLAEGIIYWQYSRRQLHANVWKIITVSSLLVSESHCFTSCYMWLSAYHHIPEAHRNYCIDQGCYIVYGIWISFPVFHSLHCPVISGMNVPFYLSYWIAIAGTLSYIQVSATHLKIWQASVKSTKVRTSNELR